MYADLLDYYDIDLVDVVEGTARTTPLLVLSLIEGLSDGSRFTASRLGGSRYLGWSEDRMILAAILDAINDNTLVSGDWPKGKRPKFKPWPRPWDEDKGKSKKKRTVKDLFRMFGGARVN